MYNHYKTSVGNDLKHIQITTKYRYRILNQEKLKVFCKVAIGETYNRHKIKIVILKVMEEHIHMIVDCPRTFSDTKLMQLIKGFSSYLIFRIYPTFRDVYPRGHFWNECYFAVQLGQILIMYFHI
ncbi:MAG: IS200/IS605 family transposase [Nanoarchaeota archaeon]